ncbi:hypothetical protein ACFJGW_12740 [Burkholderiaceae bacterium UC74_6]
MNEPLVPVDPDPVPQPPPELDFDACCGNGCDPCIVDLHCLAMDDYRQALRAWQARHPEADPADSQAVVASSPNL